MQIHELGILFQEVQLQNILADGKTFPDCTPLRPLEEINGDYLACRNSSSFDLKQFVFENFSLPKAYSSDYKSDPNKSAEQHIKDLWNVLMRQPDEAAGSLIPLPYPYIVPGGRFREIYYWDSYFTMLGLRESNRLDLIENMIDNFSYLIETYGYIPNGNRTYFLGRSQPPFFSLMVQLLSEEKRKVNKSNDLVDPLVKYLPSLEKEWEFWMKGMDDADSDHPIQQRVFLLREDSLLNRYWDEHDSPRPESYKEDVELSHQSKQKPETLFRHLRAAAESGWDFSSRWFKDVNSFATIHTTDIIPVDLNCLLLHLEKTLHQAYQLKGDASKVSFYDNHFNLRKGSINSFLWDDEKEFYFDYNFAEQKRKDQLTLAAAFPLFFNIADVDQANSVEKILRENFLKAGGMTTTLESSGQQWDAPNGWAPLQWITYKGLLNYGFDELANKLKSNWLSVNKKVYSKTGKMTEKYDVWNESGEASGGEYPNQDGFGWTNGVFLAMNSHE